MSLWWLILLLSFFLLSSAEASPVNLEGVFWDLKAYYGDSGGTIDEESSSYLTPSLPYEYTVPAADYVEVYDDYEYFYAYAAYEADVDELSAEVSGFADIPNISNNESYYAEARVALGSNTFTGVSLFTLSFDWEYTLDLTDNTTGKVSYAVGLIDYSETTDLTNPVFIYSEVVSFDDNGTYSGHYENSWNLDPSHQYLFGIGILAETEGTESSDGSDAYIEISNVRANAVPEPASLLLLGAGGLLVILYRRKKR